MPAHARVRTPKSARVKQDDLSGGEEARAQPPKFTFGTCFASAGTSQ
jgi:hypothetical protein